VATVGRALRAFRALPTVTVTAASLDPAVPVVHRARQAASARPEHASAPAVIRRGATGATQPAAVSAAPAQHADRVSIACPGTAPAMRSRAPTDAATGPPARQAPRRAHAARWVRPVRRARRATTAPPERAAAACARMVAVSGPCATPRPRRRAARPDGPASPAARLATAALPKESALAAVRALAPPASGASTGFATAMRRRVPAAAMERPASRPRPPAAEPTALRA
jgi:hypothetical protein